MKARILNKNLSTVGDYSSAKSFSVDEGAVLTICKNETLDSAVIKISNLEDKLEIEPFDVCVLSDFQLTTRKMLVDTFTETITCLNPRIYSYEIHLFSLTKELENYVCPTLKITKVWGQTRTITRYVEEYVDLYGPKIRIKDGNSYQWVNKYSVSTRLTNKFSVECPEMQWNNPTLREVLNDLLMVRDCIVIINQDNEIDYMDLTETYEDISESDNINYITSSQSSEDYVSELKVNLVNVTNSRQDNVLNTVTRSEWHPVISDNAVVTTDNWVVKTQYPIYKLKSLKILFFKQCTCSVNGVAKALSGWFEEDLMNATLVAIDNQLAGSYIEGPLTLNLVSEYKEWETKKTYFQKLYVTRVPMSEWPDWKNYSLYYTRGTNEIRNFTYLAEKYALDNTRQLIDIITDNIMLAKLKELYPNADAGSIYIPDTFDSSEWLNMFCVEYETLQDAVFTASKGDNPSHKRTVIDNQTNSYVDSYNQGFLEYQKANRLGNLQLQINARYTDDYNSIIGIGDYYDDSVVYQVQYQIYKAHIEVNAIATKNYVLRNYFTGVKAKIRSWKIADGSEALTRHDLVKYYLEFSFIKHSETVGIDNSVFDNTRDFLSPLTSSSDIKPIKYTAVKTDANATENTRILVYNSDMLSGTITSLGGGEYESEILFYMPELIASESVLPQIEFSLREGSTLTYLSTYSYSYTTGYVTMKATWYGGLNDSEDILVKIYKSYYFPGVSSWYLEDTVNRIIGNSMVFTFGFKDNYDVGKNFDTRANNKDNITSIINLNTSDYSYGGEIGGVPTQYCRYVDSNGEFESAKIRFLSDLNITIPASSSTSDTSNIEFLAEVIQKPVTSNDLVTNKKIEYDLPVYYRKDSQEITYISTQFEFCSDTTNICFTKEFINRQLYVRTVRNQHTLKIKQSETYDFRNISLPSDAETVNVIRYIGAGTTSSNNSVEVDILTNYYSTRAEARAIVSGLLNSGALYIVDENDVLLLAIDGRVRKPSFSIYGSGSSYYGEIRIYLNILKDRDKNIYQSQSDQTIKGEL